MKLRKLRGLNCRRLSAGFGNGRPGKQVACSGRVMVHDLVAPISTVQQAQEVFAQGFSAEILLTNLGAVEFNDTYGPLTLHALWGPSVHIGFATGQTVGAVTVGDQLHLLHTSYEPPRLS